VESRRDTSERASDAPLMGRPERPLGSAAEGSQVAASPCWLTLDGGVRHLQLVPHLEQGAVQLGRGAGALDHHSCALATAASTPSTK
jgi:hypothetical protein